MPKCPHLRAYRNLRASQSLAPPSSDWVSSRDQDDTATGSNALVLRVAGPRPTRTLAPMTHDEPHVDPPRENRYCAVCGAGHASFGFGRPGALPADVWY